jgi:hypothetical protein
VECEQPLMRILLLFLIVLLSSPLSARTPEETVRKVYQAHLDGKGFKDTLSQCEDCFTPGFLSVMERALAGEPGKDADWVDFDFFVNSQAGFARFEVGTASVKGKEAKVPIRIWNDERGYKFEKDPQRRQEMAFPALIHLVDVGHGLQITNIEFIGHLRDNDDYKSFTYFEGSLMRPILEEIGKKLKARK